MKKGIGIEVTKEQREIMKNHYRFMKNRGVRYGCVKSFTTPDGKETKMPPIAVG